MSTDTLGLEHLISRKLIDAIEGNQFQSEVDDILASQKAKCIKDGLSWVSPADDVVAEQRILDSIFAQVRMEILYNRLEPKGN